MTRLLYGSRNSVCTTRGEYWLDASWMMSSDTENAMPANAIVAAAIVLNNARALLTVEVNPKGRSVPLMSMWRSNARLANPKVIEPNTASIGTKNKLARNRSNHALP